MKRLLFYIFLYMSLACRLIKQRWYMRLIVKAHSSQGVIFDGVPEYIHQDAYLDPSGGLTIGKGVVISTRVIILTHDWSFLKRINRGNKNFDPISPVLIGNNSFIGAGAIILPGSIIGKNCIVGAGSVVKGYVKDGQIVVGNPARVVGNT